MKLISDRVKITKKPSETHNVVVGHSVFSVPSEVIIEDSRSSVSKMSSSGVEGAILVAFRKHIQDLQAENDGSLSSCVRKRMVQMHTLLKLLCKEEAIEGFGV